MITRMEAITNVYSEVVSLLDGRAFDKDGNVVELDESKITTEIARLQAE